MTIENMTGDVRTDLSKEDIVNLLAEDDNEKEPEPKEGDGEIPESDEEEEPKEPKADKEDEEKEEDEEEIKLEDLEEVDFQHVPRKKEVLAKYPNFYKEFPGFERAIYREQQYSEVFPTVTEAKEAVEAVKEYKEFESALLSGNLVDVLKSVKNADENAFQQIGDNILQTLAQIDQKVYHDTVSTVMQNALYSLAKAGVESENENLKTAALILNQYLFGKTEIKPPVAKQVRTEQSDAEKQLQQQQRNFAQQQYEVALNDVTTRTENIIKSNVERAIDPKGVMTPYVKSKAVSDVVTEVNKALSSDARFRLTLNNLWENSFKNNHNEASKQKIRNALLSKTKSVLTDIVRKVRSEALKSPGRKASDEEVETKKLLPRGGVRPSERSSKDKAPPPGIKTFDYLNQD